MWAGHSNFAGGGLLLYHPATWTWIQNAVPVHAALPPHQPNTQPPPPLPLAPLPLPPCRRTDPGSMRMDDVLEVAEGLFRKIRASVACTYAPTTLKSNFLAPVHDRLQLEVALDLFARTDGEFMAMFNGGCGAGLVGQCAVQQGACGAGRLEWASAGVGAAHADRSLHPAGRSSPGGGEGGGRGERWSTGAEADLAGLPGAG